MIIYGMQNLVLAGINPKRRNHPISGLLERQNSGAWHELGFYPIDKLKSCELSCTISWPVQFLSGGEVLLRGVDFSLNEQWQVQGYDSVKGSLGHRLLFPEERMISDKTW